MGINNGNFNVSFFALASMTLCHQKAIKLCPTISSLENVLFQHCCLVNTIREKNKRKINLYLS